ncbi:MAG: bifunctional phosphoribosyl-AMP cyclohydrolase/phosphoribosyl-ATP diphosphatase HisIE [Ignavibacteria bacterium]|nr:bifunctional phosphoribosyl-AMP cyclohydrolase/phosphoribosyl-ATP diphosphatase HisIE [Ignavibacteria bacterium]
MINIETLRFDKLQGLIPAIIIHKVHGSVLMLGFMNQEALQKTIQSGLVTFYSRTRSTLWTKGETSGNYLHVDSIVPDCDNDTLLITVVPEGNVCHTGAPTCFAKEQPANIEFLQELYNLILTRKEQMPEGSYTTRLFERGSDRIIQKVGEEAVESVIAAKNRDTEQVKNEVADLFFHVFVMLAEQGIALQDIVDTLRLRHKPKS